MTQDSYDPDFEQFDPVTVKNGMPGCAACGSLLCVQLRTKRESVEGLIAHKLFPAPVEDVETVLCAGCSAVLFDRGD